MDQARQRGDLQTGGAGRSAGQGQGWSWESGGAGMQLESSTSCVSQRGNFLLCVSIPSSVNWAWGHPGQHVEVRIR